jgi:hypothetical protein
MSKPSKEAIAQQHMEEFCAKHGVNLGEFFRQDLRRAFQSAIDKATEQCKWRKVTLKDLESRAAQPQAPYDLLYTQDNEILYQRLKEAFRKIIREELAWNAGLKETGHGPVATTKL